MPLSNDPVKRARQLANLRRSETIMPVGNTRALRYGAHATTKTLPVAGKAAAIYAELEEMAPLRDHDGELPRADRMVVELFALCLARLDAVVTYLTMHGALDERGKLRPAAEYEVKLRREAAGYAEALGMSPRSRARLGLDLTRTQTFAEQLAAMSEAGEQARARLRAIDAAAEDEEEGGDAAA